MSHIKKIMYRGAGNKTLLLAVYKTSLFLGGFEVAVYKTLLFSESQNFLAIPLPTDFI